MVAVPFLLVVYIATNFMEESLASGINSLTWTFPKALTPFTAVIHGKQLVTQKLHRVFAAA